MGNRVNASAAAIAFRALRKEILGFDFRYPLDIDPAAGPRDSLHYYLYSNALKWEAMRMDSAGIPRTWDRTTGTTYWPGYIAWYALVQLGHYLRGSGAQHLDIFLKQIDWLEENAVVRADGTVVWTMNFDYREGSVLLRAPWVSAHAQGLAISAMVRGWRVTGKPHLLELLRRSADIFDLDESRGGIRAQIDGHTFFTEKPGCPLPGILDGFMTSLLGLYDLNTEIDDAGVAERFRAGMAGLKELLPWWDYGTKWSWYGCREYLSPPAYHCLNRLLLSVLGGLSGDSDLKELADCWNPANLSRIERAQIYLSFLATKNAARLRHRTWLHKSLPES
jgi:hypothetical protein